MIAAIAFGGVFYVSCVAVQTLGFGTDPAGVRAFAGSAAPIGELAQRYVGRGMADVLNLAAIISAIGEMISTRAGITRLVTPRKVMIV